MSRRPRNSLATSTGTPAATSSASASIRRRRPGSPWASQATAVCGRSPRILPTSPVRTRPGPASTKTLAPAAYMASTCSTKRTGFATCPASTWRISAGRSGYGAAVMFDHTGYDGVVSS